MSSKISIDFLSLGWIAFALTIGIPSAKAGTCVAQKASSTDQTLTIEKFFSVHCDDGKTFNSTPNVTNFALLIPNPGSWLTSSHKLLARDLLKLGYVEKREISDANIISQFERIHLFESDGTAAEYCVVRIVADALDGRSRVPTYSGFMQCEDGRNAIWPDYAKSRIGETLDGISEGMATEGFKKVITFTPPYDGDMNRDRPTIQIYRK